MARSRRKGVAALGIRLALSLLVAAVLIEAAFHLSPRLLPSWYRQSLPMDGIELDRPGVLAVTPPDELPLPWIAGGWDGPPPADLVDKGLVAPGEPCDRERYPRVVVPSDARGLPNPVVLERAGIVCVGDSFMVAAASTEPPGLVSLLGSELSRDVYDLGVGGVGPYQESWLLRTVGLDLEPELVLWFFFGGNDLVDARIVRNRLEDGVESYAQEEGYRAPPRLFLPDLLRVWLAGTGPRPDPLPPLELRTADGSARPFWFLPRHLFMLTMPVEVLRGHRGWQPTREILLDARRRVEERGARLAVVYVPSKAQVYLPLVEHDAGLVYRMLTFDGVELETSPEELLGQMLANRGALEELLRTFCAEAGIPFFSATPALEALGTRGELGYLTCDTHWAAPGQAAVAGPLIGFCRGLLRP